MVESKKSEKKQYNESKLEGVELVQFKKIKQKASPFLNEKRSWEDEELFMIPEDI